MPEAGHRRPADGDVYSSDEHFGRTNYRTYQLRVVDKGNENTDLKESNAQNITLISSGSSMVFSTPTHSSAIISVLQVSL